MKTLKFDVYSDAGHGWVKVKKSLLREFGIENEVTAYSYMRGDYAYLEEDCDASLLIHTLREHNIEIKFREHQNRGLRQSKIRGYDYYKPLAS